MATAAAVEVIAGPPPVTLFKSNLRFSVGLDSSGGDLHWRFSEHPVRDKEMWQSSTSSELSLRATTMARQRRVNASITVSMRNRLPSSVRS